MTPMVLRFAAILRNSSCWRYQDQVAECEQKGTYFAQFIKYFVGIGLCIIIILVLYDRLCYQNHDRDMVVCAEPVPKNVHLSFTGITWCM